MKFVKVVEEHHSNTKDMEGFAVDERKFELNSEDFLEYLAEFNVREKYEKKMPNWVGSIEQRGKLISTTETYFNGWVDKGVGGKAEMCYIVIEYPI